MELPLGRWGRAARWLPAGRLRVLDVGCAFGFGSAVLRGGRPGRWVAGLEPDPALVRQGHRRYPWLPLLQGDGTALPVAGRSVDAVVLLDVLEHSPAPGALLAEARRVLRPGGLLLLSVPYRGPLAGLDSLNLYSALQRRWRSLPDLQPGESSAGGGHRHFGLDEVSDLLGPGLVVERVWRSGVGLAEPLHLALLLACRGVLRWEGLYRALRYVYFGAYLVEDLLPAGPAGYHLAVRARAIALTR